MLDFIRSVFSSEPPLTLKPDTTGQTLWGGITDAFVDVHLNHNSVLPRKGDVVAKLETCSMGVNVRRDTRYRVTGPGPYPGSVFGESNDGVKAVLYPEHMRRDTEMPRFWWLFG